MGERKQLRITARARPELTRATVRGSAHGLQASLLSGGSTSSSGGSDCRCFFRLLLGGTETLSWIRRIESQSSSEIVWNRPVESQCLSIHLWHDSWSKGEWLLSHVVGSWRNGRAQLRKIHARRTDLRTG